MTNPKYTWKFPVISPNASLFCLLFVLVLGFQSGLKSITMATTTATAVTDIIKNPRMNIVVHFTSNRTISLFQTPDNDNDNRNHPQSRTFVFEETVSKLAIECISPFPIEWRSSCEVAQHQFNYLSIANRSRTNRSIYVSEGQNDHQNSAPAPSIHGIFNPEEFFYHLFIFFVPKENFFGYVGSCQNVIEKSFPPSTSTWTVQHTKTNCKTADEEHKKSSSLETRLNIFYPDRDSKARYFIGAGRRFKILNRQKTKMKIAPGVTFGFGFGFLIPCPLINPKMSMAERKSVEIILVRIFKTRSKNGVLRQVESEYDPEAGFYVSGEAELQGTFQCLANFEKGRFGGLWNKKETVTFDFVQNRGQYQAQNREDWLEIKNPKDSALDFEKRKTRASTAIYTFWYAPNEVQCSADDNAENSNSDSNQLFQIYCRSLVDCDVLYACFLQVCGRRVISGVPCEKGEGEKCRILIQPYTSGLFKCSFGGSPVYAYAFMGIDGIQYFTEKVSFPSNMTVSKSALIRFEIIGQPTNTNVQQRSADNVTLTLYTNKLYTFECTASNFFFIPTFIFLAVYENETTEYFPQESIRVIEHIGIHDIGIEVHVNLTCAVTGVICYAPWSHSEKWENLTIPLTVTDMTRPKIQTDLVADAAADLNGGAIERIFYIGEKERVLSCSATGNPEPTLTWTFENGTEVIRNSNMGSGFSTTVSERKVILQFPTISKNCLGIYFCEARNEAGLTRQTFRVRVKAKASGFTTVSGLGSGEIIGLSFGIILFVTAFLFISYKYLKTRRQLRNLTAVEIDDFKHGNPEMLKNAEIQGKNAHLLPFNKKYEIPTSEFSIDQAKILGSGEFGVVYRGKLRQVDVAIKTTKSTADVDFFKAFLNEIKVMTFIGQHPNVVQLLGTSTSRIRERIVFVILELGVHGNLHSFLKKNRSHFIDTLSTSQIFNVNKETSCENTPLLSKMIGTEISTESLRSNSTTTITVTTLDLIKWCGQIAAGMSHLASKKIIHRDLAARNILLFDDYTAKITDFGLSRQLYTSPNYVRKNRQPLPWRSMAPESLKQLEFSTKSDVWAFGILAWEIFSLAELPYSGLNWTSDFADVLISGLRLQKPKWASNEIYENMCDCWNLQPEGRPDFDQIFKFYNSIHQLCRKSETIYLQLE